MDGITFDMYHLCPGKNHMSESKTSKTSNNRLEWQLLNLRKNHPSNDLGCLNK